MVSRQGIVTSEEELERIINELRTERLETNINQYGKKQLVVLPIINKTIESDTWRFE